MIMLHTSSALVVTIIAVVCMCSGSRRNGTVKLPVKERYRRLIPYMTFYQHGQEGNAGGYRGQNDNQLELSRYQGYNQGYNHGFVHNQGGYVPYQLNPQSNEYYVQGPSTVRNVAQNYLSVKNNRQPGRQQYVQQQVQHVQPQVQHVQPQVQHVQPQVQQVQPPRLPQPPKFLTGFRPMDPNAITITQSQELQVQQNTQRTPYHQDIVDSQRPTYVITTEQASPRPYVTQEQESPRPFVVTVEPNSQPILQPEQNSQRPYVQFIPTTFKPQYYTPVSNHIYPTPSRDYDQDNNYNLLTGYDISNVLPTRITSDNLESSIKTLSKLLQILQKANALPQSAKKLTKVTKVQQVKIPIKVKPAKHQYVEEFDDEGSTPGKPGVDYPTYTKIPQTAFTCKEQRYKGFFGDPETHCQVWHYCDLNGGQASFLCPNGTIFSQVALTCDWWFNVKCASTAQLYVLNERLYKYIIPQKPSFPEDFSGPLVDRYLEQKFREIEEQKRKNATQTTDNDDDDDDDETPAHETNEARRSIEY